MTRWPQKGLDSNRYDQMIKAAFHEQWWRSSKVIRVNADGSKTLVAKNKGECGTGNCSANEYSLMQYNFALFFGIAVQMYEATLVSDDTPWDRFRRQHAIATDPALNPWNNPNPDHISRLALFGAHLFNDRTRGATNIRCSNCHEQAELTDASARRIADLGTQCAIATATSSTGASTTSAYVRPRTTSASAASDVFGPLSHTRRDCSRRVPAELPARPVTKGFGVEGAFKIPSLRNVALTAPYFHNGEARTLREAVELYSRGGNVHPVQAMDGTPIEPLGVPSLTTDEIDAIVAFLESLTDERVLYRRAPFDHPQLFVPNGHAGELERCHGRQRRRTRGRQDGGDSCGWRRGRRAAAGLPRGGILTKGTRTFIFVKGRVPFDHCCQVALRFMSPQPICAPDSHWYSACSRQMDITCR